MYWSRVRISRPTPNIGRWGDRNESAGIRDPPRCDIPPLCCLSRSTHSRCCLTGVLDAPIANLKPANPSRSNAEIFPKSSPPSLATPRARTMLRSKHAEGRRRHQALAPAVPTRPPTTSEIRRSFARAELRHSRRRSIYPPRPSTANHHHPASPHILSIRNPG